MAIYTIWIPKFVCVLFRMVVCGIGWALDLVEGKSSAILMGCLATCVWMVVALMTFDKPVTFPIGGLTAIGWISSIIAGITVFVCTDFVEHNTIKIKCAGEKP